MSLDMLEANPSEEDFDYVDSSLHSDRAFCLKAFQASPDIHATLLRGKFGNDSNFIMEAVKGAPQKFKIIAEKKDAFYFKLSQCCRDWQNFLT